MVAPNSSTRLIGAGVAVLLEIVHGLVLSPVSCGGVGRPSIHRTKKVVSGFTSQDSKQKGEKMAKPIDKY